MESGEECAPSDGVNRTWAYSRLGQKDDLFPGRVLLASFSHQQMQTR